MFRMGGEEYESIGLGEVIVGGMAYTLKGNLVNRENTKNIFNSGTEFRHRTHVRLHCPDPTFYHTLMIW